MASISKPKDMAEFQAKLFAEWKDFGVLSVGSGFGVEGVYDFDPPRWLIYVYAKNPEEIRGLLPSKVGGYPVILSGIPVAY